MIFGLFSMTPFNKFSGNPTKNLWIPIFGLHLDTFHTYLGVFPNQDFGPLCNTFKELPIVRHRHQLFRSARIADVCALSGNKKHFWKRIPQLPFEIHRSSFIIATKNKQKQTTKTTDSITTWSWSDAILLPIKELFPPAGTINVLRQWPSSYTMANCFWPYLIASSWAWSAIHCHSSLISPKMSSSPLISTLALVLALVLWAGNVRDSEAGCW